MSDIVKDFKVVSLIPLEKNGWHFKVSANNYEEGVLIAAANYTLGFVTCKYFVDSFAAREWINTLAFNIERDKSTD